MSVSERLRSVLPGSDEGLGDAVEPPSAVGWWRGGVVGVVTGLGSALLVVAPVVLAWLVEPLASGTVWQAVGTGSALWLLVSGAHLVAGEVTISVVPLLGWGVLVGAAWWGAREAMVDVSTDGEYWRGTAAPLAGCGSRGLVGGVRRGRRSGGRRGGRRAVPGRPGCRSRCRSSSFPSLATALALRRVARDDPDAVGPRLGFAWVPDVVLRGLRPGLFGAGVLLLVGALAVVGAVALSWGEVSTISREVGAAGLGGVVLVAAQVASLPNLALWAVSFLAGPGFRVVEGGTVTWSGADSGLMPMVPVLAALPQPGAFPWFTALSCLVVVVVGGLVARRALAQVARLSRLRTKLGVALAGCVTTAVVLGALDVLAGGSLGQFRLSGVGAPALRLFVALVAELSVGALVVVLRDAWRLRR